MNKQRNKKISLILLDLLKDSHLSEYVEACKGEEVRRALNSYSWEASEIREVGRQIADFLHFLPFDLDEQIQGRLTKEEKENNKAVIKACQRFKNKLNKCF